MLRRIDRVLAPVTWVAAAFTVLALLIGPSLIGAEKEPAAEAAAPDGQALFADTCGGCHTLARAETSGSSGPNLDDAKPDAATVKAVATDGKGSMPSFSGSLSAAEIDAVAAFVAGVEATPTPTATPAEATGGEPPEERVTFVSTGRGPDGVTFDGKNVWVTHATAGTLQRFDASNKLVSDDPIRVGRQPDNPAVAGDAVWLVLSGEDAVARVTDGQVERFPVGDAPEDLAIAGDTVWVANAGDATVSRLDRASGQPLGSPIAVGESPLGIAARGGTVWVTSNAEDAVYLIDAETGTVRGEPVEVGDRPRAVDVGGGSAWVADSAGDTVTRVRDGRAIEVGDNPRDLVFSRGAVWVANAGDDTVMRIDARSGEVGDPVKVGDDPIGIAAGRDAVWTTGFRDDTLARVPVP